VQDPVTGVWYQILDMPAHKGNYLEASASSMFVYSLAKAVRKGYIDSAYDEVARRGYRGILKEFVSVEEGLVSLKLAMTVTARVAANTADRSRVFPPEIYLVTIIPQTIVSESVSSR